MRVSRLLLAAVAVPAVASAQPAEPEIRHGLTFAADVGLGVTRTAPEPTVRTEGGPSGLNLGVGLWVTPEMMLLARVSNVAYDFDGNGTLHHTGLFGANLQMTVGDRGFMSGGVGIGLRDDGEPGTMRGHVGFALDLRAGYELWQSGHHVIYTAAELSPGWYEDIMRRDGSNVTVSTVAVQLGWQYL